MIGSDLFVSVFGGAPAHTGEHLTEHLRAVIRAGFSPVICKPGTKEPVCILSAAGARRADKAAQAQALAVNPKTKVDRIRHACGMKHVLDDPARVGPVIRRLSEIYPGAQLNVALHLGRSRMLVVDADTPSEREAFHASWATQGWDPAAPGLTVESPGFYDQVKREWIHWDGGHWWMPLPDGFEIPASGKVLKGPGGWAAMYGESYVLVPPALRAEGAYRLVGGTVPPPGWMLGMLTSEGARRSQALHERGVLMAGAGGPIDQWSAGTSWASLLEPRGWIETSMTEGSCGCPIWTAPGDHASPKSATAHDLTCARFDVSEGWGPLKIWTDHPPDGLPAAGTVTKLQFVAATDHDGDDGAAIRGLGIERAPVPAAWEVPSAWTGGQALRNDLRYLPPPRVDQPTAGQAPEGDPFGTPGGPPPDPSVPRAGHDLPGATEEQRPTWADADLGPFLDGTWSPAVPTMLPRSDGLCLFYPGLTHSIHGESESGKSWIAQCECARLIKAGFHVKYTDFESDPGSVTHRMLALGCTPAQIRACFHYSAPEVKPGADLLEYEQWERMFTGTFALVVIDGVTDALGLWALKTSDNDDWTAFNRNFPKRLARETGAGVVMIDHVTKSQDGRGRFALGGQAKMNTVTGAAYVVDVIEPMGIGRRGVLAVGLAKDKGGHLRGRLGPMDRHRIQPVGEFILDGSIASAGLMWVLRPPPEPVLEVVDERMIKVVEYVQQYPGQSQSVIARETGIRPADVIPVLRELESSGKLVIERIGQKHTHTMISPITSGAESPTATTPTQPLQ